MESFFPAKSDGHQLGKHDVGLGLPVPVGKGGEGYKVLVEGERSLTSLTH